MVAHAQLVVNGKLQEYRTLCNSTMGIRGNQSIVADPALVTCKRCLSKIEKAANRK